MTAAELIAELKVARPVADGTLHERVRAIAAAEPRQRPSLWARVSPRRLTLVAVPLTAVVAVAVAGVAGILDAGSPVQRAPETAALQQTHSAVDRAAAAQPAPAAKSGAAAAGAASVPAPTPGRAQSYSAQLTIAVKSVDALSNATQRALQTTRDLGGYLVTASYATSTSGTSSLTLRVPTARVQDAIVRLSSLGRIVAQQVQIDDLQGQLDELTKQEAGVRERIARLSARLAESSLEPETRATLEARRSAARAELAQLRAAHAQVGGQAREATIQLTLQTDTSSFVPAARSPWRRALDRAGAILAVEATIVLFALAVLGPLALAALLARLGLRSLRRREHERLLSAP
jgi:Domain of unknown function (DUF4349)